MSDRDKLARATDGGHDMIRLFTAANQIEARALQGYLEANGVQCYIQGAEHNALYGGLGDFLIELHLLVPSREAERAAELVTAFRNAEPVIDEDEWRSGDAPDGYYSGSPDSDDDQDSDGDQDGEGAPLVRSSRLGRNPRLAALLALLPSFGSAHFYTGVVSSGHGLKALQLLGVMLFVFDGVPSFLYLLSITTAVMMDMHGGIQRAVRNAAAQPQPLPRAELPRMKLLRDKTRPDTET
ncbi:MAG: DUF2007 domain-containing protein [Myxococcota bacterium]